MKLRFLLPLTALFLAPLSAFADDDLMPKCEIPTLKGDAACWHKVDEHSNCYVWNPKPQHEENFTWSGQCANGKAEGRGKETNSYLNDGARAEEQRIGSYANGKKQGSWFERYTYHVKRLNPFYPSEGEGEGPYVDGKQHGHWIYRFDEIGVFEGPYVDGKENGDWVWRFDNGTVREGPLVDGELHGYWVERYYDGSVSEGPYRDGYRHGDWVIRDASTGWVEEGPYRDGYRHGDWVVRRADGTTVCVIYRNNQEIGHRDGEC